MTLPEVLLWRLLKLRPHGLKFRRQHPIGPYVVDFYAPAVKLAIETDGVVHDRGDAPARDMRRDHWLNEQGITMLRIAARDVLSSPEAAAEAIVGAVQAGTHPSITR